MPHIGPASVARFHRVCPVRKCHGSVQPKIDDDLDTRIKAVNMSRLMIVWIYDKSYAIEPK
jgi:hypothetical protein